MTSETPLPRNPEEALADLRRRMEATDAEILRLRNLRADLAAEVGHIRSGRGAASPEGAILDRLVAAHPGLNHGVSHEPLFQEVHSAFNRVEKPMRVAFLGPAGNFTHRAVEARFGLGVQCLPFGTLNAVFRAIERGQAEVGVVPLESAMDGVVDSIVDNFLSSPLRISGEISLPVSVALLAHPGLAMERVARVYSHPKTLTRCRRWLEEKLPSVTLVEVPSSSEASQMAMEDPQGAAVASETAVRIFGLDVLGREIQDLEGDAMRFLVVGHEQPEPSGRDRSTVLLTVKDGPGTLMGLLEPFARRGVNLSRLETRPSRLEASEQAIYLEVDGHASDDALVTALAQLRPHCSTIKVLGSYPRG